MQSLFFRQNFVSGLVGADHTSDYRAKVRESLVLHGQVHLVRVLADVGEELDDLQARHEQFAFALSDRRLTLGGVERRRLLAQL